MFERVVSSTAAPQRTILSLFLFTLYTSDFQYNSESCHLQKYLHDSAVFWCISDGQEAERFDVSVKTRQLLKYCSVWSFGVL